MSRTKTFDDTSQIGGVANFDAGTQVDTSAMYIDVKCSSQNCRHVVACCDYGK